MTKLDWLFLALLGIGFIRGWIKGVIQQLVALAAFIVGIYVALAFDHSLAFWLSPHLHLVHQTALIVAFVLLFVACALVLLVVGKMVSAFFKIISLGWVDCGIGAVLGLLKVALIIGVALQLFEMFPMAKSSDKSSPTHSFLYQSLAAFPSKVLPFVDIHFLENQKKNQ
ncbi:MAG: CvpA family protein [Microbacter sp.]